MAVGRVSWPTVSSSVNRCVVTVLEMGEGVAAPAGAATRAADVSWRPGSPPSP